MSIIGELAVNVAMKTQGFGKSQRKINTGMRGMAAEAKRATSAFKKMAAAIGIGLGARALAGSLKRTAEQLDSLAKTSRKLGLTAQSLHGLRHAAQRTGVEARTMDMAMQRMVRRVSEAARGTGEAKDALIELGVSAKELNQLAPDQAFLRIADAMRGVSGQSDKVRLAFKLFDSEGVALVNTLGEGSGKLREMMAEAKKLTGTLDDEALKQIERFNDELERLMKLTKSFGQKIIIDIAPGAADFLEGVSALVEFHKTGEFSPLKDTRPETTFLHKGQMTHEQRAAHAQQVRRKFGVQGPAFSSFAGKKANQGMEAIGKGFMRGFAAVQDRTRSASVAASMLLLKEQFKFSPLADKVDPDRTGPPKETKRPSTIGSLSVFEAESVRGFRALRQNLRKDEEKLQLDKKRNDLLENVDDGVQKFVDALAAMGDQPVVTIPPA